MIEQWTPIAGFPQYQISDAGRVRSLRSDLILKTSIVNGREIITLRTEDHRKTTRSIRKLVETHFPLPEKLSLPEAEVLPAPVPAVPMIEATELPAPFVPLAEQPIMGLGYAQPRVVQKPKKRGFFARLFGGLA